MSPIKNLSLWCANWYSNTEKTNQYSLGSIRQNRTSLALTALASITFFSLMGSASAQSTSSSLNPYQFPNRDFFTDRITCPAIELQEPAFVSCQKAIETFKSSEVQNCLLEVDVGQSTALNALYNNVNLTKFLHDEKIQKEMDEFFNTLPYPAHSHGMSKCALFSSHVNNEIDVSKLVSGNPSDLNPLSKIFQSHIGINLAKPGDKNILLFASADPASDHNGAFSISQHKKNFLKNVSQEYPVHFVDASNITELFEKAQKTARDIGNIKILVINGHGSESSLWLGPGLWDTINTTLATPFPIDSDGAIILRSCSGGQGGINNLGNLVNHLSCLHPGVSVYGQTGDGTSNFQIEDLSQRKFKILGLEAIPTSEETSTYLITEEGIIPVKQVSKKISYCAKAFLKQEPYPFTWIPFTTRTRCHIEEC